MKKLLCYLKEYKKESVLGPLFKLLEATLELFVPLVVAAIIDTGIGNQDRGYVVKMCLVLVLLGLIGLAFSVTAQYFAAKAAVGFVTTIRHVLFGHIQKLSHAELDTQGTSTLITRMTSDMNQVQNGVNLTLRLLLRSPFVVIGAMVMAFTIDVKAALVFVVGIPALAVVVFGVMLACIPLYRKVQNRLDKVLGLTKRKSDRRSCPACVLQRRRAGSGISEAESDTDRYTEVCGTYFRFAESFDICDINVAIIALIWIGAIRVDMGIITQGAVVAMYNYMSQILTELIKLANLIINITKSVACGNRIQSVLEVEPSVKDGAAMLSGAGEAGKSAYRVVFEHAGIRYPDAAQEAVSDITLNVRPGETIGIIGGTGSGKSSLVNLIPRFYDCSSGAVYVDGRNVCTYGLTELRDKIGVVPQKSVLFAGTIRSNMQWGKPDATDEEIFCGTGDCPGKRCSIKERKRSGYRSRAGRKEFSGGQRQRLTIARALVKQPEILILDDSSSALDFATDAALRMAIGSMKHKPTLFIVSQRTSAIQYADKIVVLDDGSVVGIGTHEELMNTCEVYREIYDSQYKRTN